jgi:hypothetical protein
MQCELIHTDLMCPKEDGLQTKGVRYVLRRFPARHRVRSLSNSLELGPEQDIMLGRMQFSLAPFVMLPARLELWEIEPRCKVHRLQNQPHKLMNRLHLRMRK